jgi:hypothetical protein
LAPTRGGRVRVPSDRATGSNAPGEGDYCQVRSVIPIISSRRAMPNRRTDGSARAKPDWDSNSPVRAKLLKSWKLETSLAVGSLSAARNRPESNTATCCNRNHLERCRMIGWVFRGDSATGCSPRHEVKDTHPPALQSLVVQPSDRLSEFCIQVSDSRRSTVQRSAGPPPRLVPVTTCADIGVSFSSHGASAAVTASRARSTADESRRSISARKGEPSTRPFAARVR